MFQRRSGANRVSGRRVGLFFAALVVVGAIALAGIFAHGNSAAPTRASDMPVPVGSTVPDFTLPSVRGGQVRLSDLRGKLVLLSFVNTRRDAQADKQDASRAQLVFLKSMYTQYGAQGLEVLAVDATVPAQAITPDELINFTYDNALPFALLSDDGSRSVAARYGLRTAPLTLLIDRQGRLVQCWDGLAPAQVLAVTISGALK